MWSLVPSTNELDVCGLPPTDICIPQGIASLETGGTEGFPPSASTPGCSIVLMLGPLSSLPPVAVDLSSPFISPSSSDSTESSRNDGGVGC